MLYITFIQELEKIAREKTSSGDRQKMVGSTLDVKTTPYGLGIHSKREGRDTGGLGYRPLAYTQGVTSAAVGGMGLGALIGPFVEGSPANIFTGKGRKKIKEGFKGDTVKLMKDVSPEMKARVAFSPKMYAADLISRSQTGELTKAEKKTLKNMGEIAKRRLVQVPKALGKAALLAGGLKALSNAASFEQARILTPSLNTQPKNRKR